MLTGEGLGANPETRKNTIQITRGAHTNADVRHYDYIKLVDEDLGARMPHSSPDGRYVVYFTSIPSESDSEIKVIDVASRIIYTLSKEPGNQYNPRWSSDGTKIVWQKIKSHSKGNYVLSRLLAVDVSFIDGEISFSEPYVFYNPEEFPEYPSTSFDFCWYPNSQNILFSAYNSSFGIYWPDLYIFNSNSNTVTNLYSELDMQSKVTPVISPNEELVIFRGEKGKIIVESVTKPNEPVLTLPGVSYYPDFNDDGSLIVYVTKNTTRSRQIRVVDMEGTIIANITQNMIVGWDGFYPSFGPGNVVLFSGRNGNEPWSIIMAYPQVGSFLYEGYSPQMMLPSFEEETQSESPEQEEYPQSEFMSEGTTFENEWPMFHHDANLSGYSNTMLPDSISYLWKFTAEDKILSSPSVVNGKAYFGSSDHYIYCIDAFDGELVWKFKTNGEVHSSPAVSEGRVVFGSADNNIYCLYAHNGKKTWSFPLEDFVLGEPVISEGKVLIGPDAEYADRRNLYCIDLVYGKILWSYLIDGPIDNAPAVAGKRVYVSTYNPNLSPNHGYIYCIDLESGQLLWRYDPGVHKQIKYFSISYNKLYVGINEYLYCLDANNGEELWFYKTDDLIYDSPAIAHNQVYFTTKKGGVFCLDAENGHEVWSNKIEERITNSPAITNNGLIIISTDENSSIYIFDPFNGELKWENHIGDYIISSPAIAYNNIYFGTLSNHLYCFGEKDLVEESMASENDKTSSEEEDETQKGITGFQIESILLGIIISMSFLYKRMYATSYG